MQFTAVSQNDKRKTRDATRIAIWTQTGSNVSGICSTEWHRQRRAEITRNSLESERRNITLIESQESSPCQRLVNYFFTPDPLLLLLLAVSRCLKQTVNNFLENAIFEPVIHSRQTVSHRLTILCITPAGFDVPSLLVSCSQYDTQ